jgi:hypothetical protein
VGQIARRVDLSGGGRNFTRGQNGCRGLKGKLGRSGSGRVAEGLTVKGAMGLLGLSRISYLPPCAGDDRLAGPSSQRFLKAAHRGTARGGTEAGGSGASAGVSRPTMASLGGRPKGAAPLIDYLLSKIFITPQA